MAKMVFDEWYGELSFAQRAAYRRYNIPPAMHTDLVARFGDDHEAIVRFIKRVVAEKGRVDYGDVESGRFDGPLA